MGLLVARWEEQRRDFSADWRYIGAYGAVIGAVCH